MRRVCCWCLRNCAAEFSDGHPDQTPDSVSAETAGIHCDLSEDGIGKEDMRHKNVRDDNENDGDMENEEARSEIANES